MMSEPLKLAANLPLKLSGMLGMLTFKPLKVQSWKALMPIEVTELPMVNVPLNPVHPAKAVSPIVVTELGMVSEPVKPLQ